jgi:hypothetical protein
LRFEKVYFSILRNMQLVMICGISRYLKDRRRRALAGPLAGRNLGRLDAAGDRN